MKTIFSDYQQNIVEDETNINVIVQENLEETVTKGTLMQVNKIKTGEKKVNKGRKKWNTEEKEKVLEKFKNHIKKKVVPKKHEVIEFINSHPDFKESDWIRIKTLVYNSYRNK